MNAAWWDLFTTPTNKTPRQALIPGTPLTETNTSPNFFNPINLDSKEQSIDTDPNPNTIETDPIQLLPILSLPPIKMRANKMRAVGGINGIDSNFKLIVVAMLSYTMGYFHRSAQNLTDYRIGRNKFEISADKVIGEGKRINDDLLICPFVKTPLKEYLPN